MKDIATATIRDGQVDDVNVETNPIQSEIDAIAAVIRALETLPRRDAERVIRYVGDRYGMTVQKSLLHGLVTS